MNSRRTRWAPSPLVGEGWGEGLVGKRLRFSPPHPAAFASLGSALRPTSPTASRACPTCAPWCRIRASPGSVGEVDRACCAVTALQRLRLLYQAFLSPGTSNHINLVWLLDLTFLRMTRGNAGRNVKSATLVSPAAFGFLRPPHAQAKTPSPLRSFATSSSARSSRSPISSISEASITSGGANTSRSPTTRRMSP